MTETAALHALSALMILQPDLEFPIPIPRPDSIGEAGSAMGQFILLMATIVTGAITLTMQLIGWKREGRNRRWLEEDRVQTAKAIEDLLKAEQGAVRSRLDATALAIEERLGVATDVLDRKLDQHTVAIKAGTAASLAAQHEANSANQKIAELYQSYLALVPTLNQQQRAAAATAAVHEIVSDTQTTTEETVERLRREGIGNEE